MRILRPAEWHSSIHAIDLQALKGRGIRGVIVDLDNTLVAWRYPRPTPAVQEWLARVRSEGLKVCIVSNGGSRRVAAFAREAGVPYIGRAAKPRGRGFREALELLGTRPGETAVVGDQIFTDVLGGNRLGLYTILVKPVSRREFIGTRLVRRVERLVLRYLERRGHVKPR